MSKLPRSPCWCVMQALLIVPTVAYSSDKNNEFPFFEQPSVANVSGFVELYIMDGFADGSLLTNDEYPTTPRVHNHFAVLVSENYGNIAINLDTRWAGVQHGDIVNAMVQLQPSETGDREDPSMLYSVCQLMYEVESKKDTLNEMQAERYRFPWLLLEKFRIRVRYAITTGSNFVVGKL